MNVGEIFGLMGGSAIKRLFVLAGIFVLGSLLVRAFDGSPATIRYRVDVTLDLNGKVVSRSTVWEMTIADNHVIGPQGPAFATVVRGEAIPIDVPGGPTLFVLRRPANDVSSMKYGGYILDCVTINLKTKSFGAAIVDAVQRFEGGGCDVKDHPMVVYATDPAEPSKLERIAYDPRKDQYQSGFSMIHIEATKTTAPITVGIVKRFPWIASLPLPALPRGLPDFPFRMLVGPGEGMVDANKIYLEDFTTEQ